MGFATDFIRQVRSDFAVMKAAATGGPPPAAIQTASDNLGMNTETWLGPGEPIDPALGYSRTPRAFDYMTGRNINARPRSTERISFTTLKGISRAYDVAQTCISHRIDSIRGVDWNIVMMDGYDENDGYIDDYIRIARQIMEYPEGPYGLPFNSWLHKYLYDVLETDSGCLYKVRNNAGRAIGLQVVDGTTITPLLDEWGRIPGRDPITGVFAEAFVQYIQGVPANWLTVNDLIYKPFRPIADSPYGLSPMESILMNANTDVRFQLFFMQQFTEGNIPAMLASAPETWTPQQLKDFQSAWDALMQGDQAIKSQVKWVPGGGQFHDVNQNATFNNDMALWLMRKTASAFHVTPSSLGYTEDTNRAVGDSQADVDNRVGDLPLMKHAAGIFSQFLQKDVGLPVKFVFDSGAEEEDVLQTAQADKLYVEMGAVSLSEIAERRFGIVDEEKMPRFIYTNTAGPIPLTDLLAGSGKVDESGAPVEGVIVPAEQKQITAIPDAAPAPLVPKPEPAPTAKAAKSEVDQFKQFIETRRKRGKWRDFEFRLVDADLAKALNESGRALVEADAFSRAGSPVTAPVAGLRKSVRDMAPKVPQHRYDLRITDYYAPQIADALWALFDLDQILAGLPDQVTKADIPDPGQILEAQIRALLGDPAQSDDLTKLLQRVAADGYTAGAHAAAEQVGSGAKIATATGIDQIDWATWEPGDTDAAMQAADGGLQRLLDARGIGIKDMQDTTLRMVGNRIAAGVAAGDGSTTIERDLRSLLGSRSEIIAHTETTRAVTAGSMSTYQVNGIDEWDLILSDDACEECVDIAADNPHSVGDSEDQPPIHPWCRCAASPHVTLYDDSTDEGDTE